MTIKDTISDWLNSMRKGLIDNYGSRGYHSGSWGGELETEVINRSNGYSAIIRGPFYTRFLIDGRAPNKDQSEDSIRAWVGWAGSTFLAKWVEDKNIIASPFAVAYKIARKGWTIPNPYNDGKLISDVINDDTIADLLKNIMVGFVNDVRSDMKTKLLTNANA